MHFLGSSRLNCIRAFQIELELAGVNFWGEGKTGVLREKALGARERTNNKPRPRWWETGALTYFICNLTKIVNHRIKHYTYSNIFVHAKNHCGMKFEREYNFKQDKHQHKTNSKARFRRRTFHEPNLMH